MQDKEAARESYRRANPGQHPLPTQEFWAARAQPRMRYVGSGRAGMRAWGRYRARVVQQMFERRSLEEPK